MAGALLLGLGTSLGFPVGLSSAADGPAHAATRVSTAASIGYVAFLAGPPVVGFLGDRVGVLHSLSVPLSCSPPPSSWPVPPPRSPPTAGQGRTVSDGHCRLHRWVLA